MLAPCALDMKVSSHGVLKKVGVKQQPEPIDSILEEGYCKKYMV
jgi:hypothetical protein